MIVEGYPHYVVFWHDDGDGPDHIEGFEELPNVGNLFDALTHFTSTVAPQLGLKNEECRMVQMDRDSLVNIFFGGGDDVSGN